MNQLAQYWQANGNTSLWNLVTGLAFRSYQPDLDPQRVCPISSLLSHLYRLLCDVGSVLYVTGPFVLALLPARGLGQLSRTYLVNLMTFQAWASLRDPPGPHVCGESLKHKRRPQCKWSSEQLRWFEPNDTPGPDRKYFLAIDCFDSVHCQPYCPW